MRLPSPARDVEPPPRRKLPESRSRSNSCRPRLQSPCMTGAEWRSALAATSGAQARRSSRGFPELGQRAARRDDQPLCACVFEKFAKQARCRRCPPGRPPLSSSPEDGGRPRHTDPRRARAKRRGPRNRPPERAPRQRKWYEDTIFCGHAFLGYGTPPTAGARRARDRFGLHVEYGSPRRRGNVLDAPEPAAPAGAAAARAAPRKAGAHRRRVRRDAHHAGGSRHAR